MVRYTREETTKPVVYTFTHYLAVDDDGHGHYKMYINNELKQESIWSPGLVVDELKKHDWKVI